MSSLNLLVAGMLLVAFAGCLSDGESNLSTISGSPSSTAPATTGAAPTTAPQTTSASPAPTTTPTSPGAANQAPTATLNAQISGLNVTFNITGADADGDDLDWTLVFDDGDPDESGNVLPAQVDHTYAAAGNYTAVLVLSDGQDETLANVTLSLAAAASGGTGGQTVSADWAAGAYGCNAPWDSAVPDAPTAGIAYAEFTVLPATIGSAFSAKFAVDGDATLWVDVVFYDADGALLSDDYVEADPWVVAGTVPAKAAFAQLSSCNADGGSAVYTAG